MGYLLLAILSSALVSVCMRLSTDKVKGNVGMLAMNYVMCMAVAGAYTGYGNIFPAVDGLGKTIGMGAINGILFLAGFVFLQMNVKKNGVVMSSIFMKLGLLVPMVLSIFLFGEIPAPLQIVGFVIAVVAIFMINMGGESGAVHAKWALIVLLLSGGSADAMAKVYEEIGVPALSSQFLFYTFAMAFLLCVMLMVFKKEKLGKMEVLYGLLVGVPNYFSARFLLKSLESVPAVIAYPTSSVGAILVITMAGVIFFGEKLTKRQWVAVGVIIAAIALLNL